MPTLAGTQWRTANTAAGLEIVCVAHKQVQINISSSDENIVARRQCLLTLPWLLCDSTPGENVRTLRWEFYNQIFILICIFMFIL